MGNTIINENNHKHSKNTGDNLKEKWDQGETLIWVKEKDISKKLPKET